MRSLGIIRSKQHVDRWILNMKESVYEVSQTGHVELVPEKEFEAQWNVKDRTGPDWNNKKKLLHMVNNFSFAGGVKGNYYAVDKTCPTLVVQQKDIWREVNVCIRMDGTVQFTQALQDTIKNNIHTGIQNELGLDLRSNEDIPTPEFIKKLMEDHTEEPVEVPQVVETMDAEEGRRHHFTM
jgi:hypothetical protein